MHRVRQLLFRQPPRVAVEEQMLHCGSSQVGRRGSRRRELDRIVTEIGMNDPAEIVLAVHPGKLLFPIIRDVVRDSSQGTKRTQGTEATQPRPNLNLVAFPLGTKRFFLWPVSVEWAGEDVERST